MVEVKDKYLSGPKSLFITHGLKFYAEALLVKYGKWMGFPEQERGRTRKPIIISGKKLRYVQIFKNRKEKKLQEVEKKLFLVKIFIY